MAEPISIAEAKKHLRVDSTVEDTLIGDKITAAREWVEDHTGLVLVRRQITESLSAFAGHTKLRAWPIAADEPITVTYHDRSGAAHAINGVTVRANTRPAFIYPLAGTRWPSACTVDGGIEATFTAGYATPADVPQKIKQAMLVMLTAFYEDREGGALFAASERSARGLCRAQRSGIL